MDRFIADNSTNVTLISVSLKSNMDRFIDFTSYFRFCQKNV